MTTVMVIIALFFVIGIVFGAVIVIAVSILRRDVGPPHDPPFYGPPGPHGPFADLDWDDPQEEPEGSGQDSRWHSYGR
jgi:hypothetical protein